MSRPRVLILSSDALFPHFFAPSSLERLDTLADWARYASGDDSPQLRTALADSDALLTTWHSPYLRGEMLGATLKVRLIAHAGGEVMSRMDLDVFERVTVTNAAGPMAEPVAEMALALVLTLVRQIPRYAAEMRAGIEHTNAEASVGETARGRRIGLVGFGRIGRAFARLAAPLGSELLVSDPHCRPLDVATIGARAVELDQLLRRSSVVVLAAGLTDETRGMIDARRLAAMPDGAFLVNVARGGLVDLDALVAELRSGRISAALDVTDPEEPLAPDHVLRSLPNVLLTPHIAAGGVETRAAMGALAVDEVARFFSGEPPRNVVTREMLERMT